MATARDAPTRVATLPASVGPGVLRITCGTADVTYPAPVGVVKVGTNHRFDDSDLVVRFTPLSTDGRTAWLWFGSEAAARRRIAQARRLRVVAFVPLTGQVFSDFDLTGAREAVAALGCR